MSIPKNVTPPDTVTRSLAADPKALASMSSRISTDPKGAVHEVAQQFESMFMDTLLKTMRETSFDDVDQSSEMQTYTGLLDEQLAQSMSSGAGMGLAHVLEQQISKLAHVDDTGPTVQPSSQVVGNLPVPARMLRAYQQQQAQGVIQAQAPVTITPTADNADALQDDSHGAAPTVVPGKARSFVKSMLPQAESAAGKLGVAPELVVAHAALESGWGKRAIRNADGSDSHNLFDIKAGSDWHGATASVLTTEYSNGVASKKMDTFRSYGSYQQAFADYANVLSSSPRYQNVLNQGRNIAGYAEGLQSGGYATDPHYAHKLVDVMSSLAQYSA